MADAGFSPGHRYASCGGFGAARRFGMNGRMLSGAVGGDWFNVKTTISSCAANCSMRSSHKTSTAVVLVMSSQIITLALDEPTLSLDSARARSTLSEKSCFRPCASALAAHRRGNEPNDPERKPAKTQAHAAVPKEPLRLRELSCGNGPATLINRLRSHV